MELRETVHLVLPIQKHIPADLLQVLVHLQAIRQALTIVAEAAEMLREARINLSVNNEYIDTVRHLSKVLS